MTIVIGVTKEKFSLVATDTRIKLLEPKDKLYEDNQTKIYETKYNWVAGSGFGPIIVSFTNNVQENNIVNLDEMYNLYRVVCMDVKSQYNELKAEDSTLVLSYSYKEDNNIRLKIDTISLKSENMYTFSSNKMFIMPPTGLSEDNIEKTYNKFNPLIQKANTLNELIYQVADCIEEVSKINFNISDICEFGFMFNIGDKFVSKKHLRGRAKDIKEICLNGNIEIQLQEKTPIIWGLDL